ncbi:Hypothetical predicted protein [Pelobates cultripes]|uniref:Uncharacterized protein n=1 Tax=Pelobates cultripes TaxID=61616 RepID=A0AAD1SAQ1_PELCU|nr:Hypothetical predicted protein [Pelobates cultripes]CAH2329389.1 Hypothetical predicted protein [Pelobates cultripes]
MVRTKKPLPSGAAAASSPHRNTGPMDDFLSTPSDLCGTRHVDKMAPGSPDSEMTVDSQSEPPKQGTCLKLEWSLHRSPGGCSPKLIQAPLCKNSEQH